MKIQYKVENGQEFIKIDYRFLWWKDSTEYKRRFDGKWIDLSTNTCVSSSRNDLLEYYLMDIIVENMSN